MSQKEMCATLADKARAGSWMAFIGHLLLIVDVIAVLIVIIPNPSSYLAYLFLVYAGWAFLAAGLILSIIGVLRRNRHINACTIS